MLICQQRPVPGVFDHTMHVLMSMTISSSVQNYVGTVYTTYKMFRDIEEKLM